MGSCKVGSSDVPRLPIALTTSSIESVASVFQIFAQEAGEFFNPSLTEVEEGRYGLGKIDLLVLRLTQSLLL